MKKLPDRHMRGMLDASLVNAAIDLQVTEDGVTTIYTGVALLDHESKLIDWWMKARDHVEAWKLFANGRRLQIVEFWVSGQSRTSYVSEGADVEFIGEAQHVEVG